MLSGIETFEMTYGFIKRIVDILAVVGTSFVTVPLFVFLSVWIKLDSPGPVFFKQKRVGRHKRFFNILKFRTMKIDTPRDTPTHLLENPEQWITRAGKFLRKTSLDELPQLINILAGDMTIVGPRPALWNQDDLVAERDRYGANDITPGITGWAQINGRDEIPIEQKARLDGEYCQKMGPLFDLKILLSTFPKVIRGSGVAEGGKNHN
jgi:Sugar transferases involved in lipopolysaccharide synthesis